MFSVICDIKKQVGVFGPGKDMYSYYNCIPILSEKGNLVFHSSNVTTMKDLELFLEKNVVGELAPFGYEDVYNKINKIYDIASIKYLALMEKNEKGMLEAGGNKYTVFSERLVKEESEKVLFDKSNTFFNDDFIDNNLKRGVDNAYHLPTKYLEEVMKKSLKLYKETMANEIPIDTQAAASNQPTELNFEERLLTWGQYCIDSVYSLYDTAVNFMYGDSVQQEL